MRPLCKIHGRQSVEHEPYTHTDQGLIEDLLEEAALARDCAAHDKQVLVSQRQFVRG